MSEHAVFTVGFHVGRISFDYYLGVGDDSLLSGQEAYEQIRRKADLHASILLPVASTVYLWGNGVPVEFLQGALDGYEMSRINVVLVTGSRRTGYTPLYTRASRSFVPCPGIKDCPPHGRFLGEVICTVCGDHREIASLYNLWARYVGNRQEPEALELSQPDRVRQTRRRTLGVNQPS